MKDLKKLVGSNEQLVLAVLLIVFILADVSLPGPLANMVDSVTGNIVVGLLALALFANGNPLLGMLGLVATYMLVSRSGRMSGGGHAAKKHMVSENSKVMDFSKYNDYPVSLEEEMVEKMAPLVKHPPAINVDYKPVLDKLHDAAPVDYTGVV